MSLSCNRKLIPVKQDSEIKLMPIVPISTINLPVYFRIDEINKLLNEQLKYSFGEGLNIEEGYKLNAQLNGEILLSALGQRLNLKLPVQIEILPKTEWSRVKAYGNVLISMTIDFNIFQDNFITKTSVDSIDWIKSPKLSILGVKVPIESIATRLVSKYKNTISSELDQYLSKVVDLKKLKEVVKRNFSQAFYSTEDSIINLYISPSEIGLGPIQVENDKLIFPMIIFLENVLTTNRPIDLYNDLSFSIRPKVEDSIIGSLQARIPMNYLEILLKENIENQSFGTGLTKIFVQKLSLSGNNKTIETTIDVTGAYNGILQIAFEPEFNESKQNISLENFKIKAVEGRKIAKAIFSLVKVIAESKIKIELEFSLNQLIQDYQKTILSFLDHKEVYPGMVLSGVVSQWNIDKFNVLDNILVFNVNAQLKAKLDVLSIDRRLFQSKAN